MISSFLKENYGIEVKKVEKIDCGVMNDNFKISSDKSDYIFRIYNNKKEADILLQVEMFKHLEENNFLCPRFIKDFNNYFVLYYNENPCVVYEYIPGENPKEASLELLEQVGNRLATMHLLLNKSKASLAKKAWDSDNLKELVVKNKEKMLASKLERSREIMDFVEKELQKYSFPEELPQGITHQDVKPENIIVESGELKAFIDFDNAYEGTLLHDITTTIIWTCFTNDDLDKSKMNAFLKGYEQKRELTKTEKENLFDAILFRLVREVFIGPFAIYPHVDRAEERSLYFMRVYKNLLYAKQQ